MATKGSVGKVGSRGSGPAASGKVELVKLKLSVSKEVARKLRLQAFGLDVSLGQVVEELVRGQPQRFVLVDRSKGASDQPAIVGQVAAESPAARGEVRTLGLHSEAG